MSHELEIKDGQARMFFAGEEPWHKLGTKVETEQTAAQAIKLAKLNWISHLEPIYIKGSKMIDNIPIVGTQIKNKQAVVRDDGEILGVVGPNYNIIQNVELFDFLDDVIGSGQAVYHTAGSLFNGSRIFITVKLTGDMKVGQDVLDKYLLLVAGHDGKLAVHVKFTPIRVVCNNTASVALGTWMKEDKVVRINSTYSFKHTNSYKQRAAEAREALNLSQYYYKHMEEEFNKMLDQQFSDTNMEQFTEELFPVGIDENGGKKKLTTRLKNNREKIQILFHNGKGQNNVANTRWAAYNAVTEFIDHHRSTLVRTGKNENEVRFDSIFYGSGKNIRQKAYDLLAIKS